MSPGTNSVFQSVVVDLRIAVTLGAAPISSHVRGTMSSNFKPYLDLSSYFCNSSGASEGMLTTLLFF